MAGYRGTHDVPRREPAPAEPGGEHDPEAAEAYAESVSIDPTPQEIDTYLDIAGASDG